MLISILYSLFRILMFIGSPGELIFPPILNYCKKKDIELPYIILWIASFLRRFTSIYGWIPTYGCYGGPAYSSGGFTKWGFLTDWTIRPVDTLDELYYVHDNSYQIAIATHDMNIANAKLLSAMYETSSEDLEKTIKEEDKKRIIKIYNADKTLVDSLLRLYLSRPQSWGKIPMRFNNSLLNTIAKYYAIIYGHASLGIFWVKSKLEYLIVKEYLK